jgi:hypothetical protein
MLHAKKYQHITPDERTLIQTQFQQGFKPATIAANLAHPVLAFHANLPAAQLLRIKSIFLR